MANFILLTVKGQPELVNVEKIIRVRPINGGLGTRIFIETFFEPGFRTDKSGDHLSHIDSIESYLDVATKLSKAVGGMQTLDWERLAKPPEESDT
jgi:hypothetical protein